MKIVICSTYIVVALNILAAHDLCGAFTVTQPIGILARTYETTGPRPFSVQPPPPIHQPYPNPNTPMQEMNYICAQWDPDEYPQTAPFDVRYPATEVILTQPQHFVRLLVTPTSLPTGAWIMRSEYVRGRTPEQLQDIFALAAKPINIVSVTMPASPDPVTGLNYALWTGIAAPIRAPGFDWGDGGSVQNRLVADFKFNGFPKTNYFPTYGYTSSATRYHQQPVGQIALSYKPLAGCGNSLCVANYLDLFIPPAYSDLENIYTILDDLNYVGYGTAPLQYALNQISPARYDTLSYISLRNAILADDTILERQLFKQWEYRWYCSCREDEDRRSKPYGWLTVIAQANKGTDAGTFNNFGYKTGGLIGSLDWQLRPDLVVGLSMAGFGNRFHWCNDGGKGNNGEGQIGFYTSYFPSSFFLDVLINGGFNRSATCRTIRFDTVDRVANACQHGYDCTIAAQTGFNAFHDFIPYLRASYFYTHKQPFCESGADSLDLAVHPLNTNTVRVQLGGELNHAFESPCYKVMPTAQGAWVKDVWLRKRCVSAHLQQLGGKFSVEGIKEEHGHFVGGVGFNVLWRNCLTLFLRYDIETIKPRTINTAQLGLRFTF